VRMRTEKGRIGLFIEELMRRHNKLPSQLAADLGVSHATVGRWLLGEDVPSTKSCWKLAEYSGIPLEKILSIAGHLPSTEEEEPLEWPELRDISSEISEKINMKT
jgi:transcriptional regulator with XRE-family HTH domain